MTVEVQLKWGPKRASTHCLPGSISKCSELLALTFRRSLCQVLTLQRHFGSHATEPESCSGLWPR